MLSNVRMLVITLTASICGFQVGCVSFGDLLSKESTELDTSLLAQQGFSVPPGGLPMQVNSGSALAGPSIVMEVRNGSRHLERIPLPQDRSMFIEDIVQQAQLAKRLGSLNISIMRSNGSGQPPVRMEVEIDSDGKSTSLGRNYALQPGDHVIVNLNDKSALEQFLEKNLGMG